MTERLFDDVFGENTEKEHPEIKFSIERITPEIAARMLEANTKNRGLKRSPIKKALQNGEWVINGDSIVFASNGRLLNGQHRLHAVVETGIAAEFIIVRGVDPKAQITMDTGSKRILADYLKMDGYPDASKVAAISKAMMRVDAYGISCYYQKGGREDSSTLLEQYDYTVGIYESRIEPIRRDTAAVANQFRIGTGLVGPLFDIFNRINADDYKEFANQVRGISNQCQPVQLLYRTLVDNASPTAKNKLTAKAVSAYFVKTWNAYMQGEELSFLRFTLGGAHPERFPEIYGMEQINVN